MVVGVALNLKQNEDEGHQGEDLSGRGMERGGGAKVNDQCCVAT